MIEPKDIVIGHLYRPLRTFCTSYPRPVLLQVKTVTLRGTVHVGIVYELTPTEQIGHTDIPLSDFLLLVDPVS